MTNLTDVIAPAFYGLHRDVQAMRYRDYWLPGGRGSTKSSCIGAEIPLNMMRDAANKKTTHALVLRRYGVTCRESVYEQIKWAIEMLGASDQWDFGLSPLQITYRPTGQKIIFRGADDPVKIKSIKLYTGYFKYLWFEELTEFSGPETIRNIRQSVLRGEEAFCVFYSYNPPKSSGNWVNREVAISTPDKRVYPSDYRDVPRHWLGEAFIAEAEHLREVNPDAYAHEYLGEVTGTGGEVFTNLTLRTITQEEIATFDNIRNGIDWGYAADPFHYGRHHYDKTRKRLFIFAEIHQLRLSNRKAAGLVKAVAGREMITCDSAEPKSIAEMKEYDLVVRGAKKGPDSVEYGIKWLQDLEEIIIDPELCPNAAREFSEYELDRDKEGNFKAGYPDRENHSIDCARYACEDDMKRPAQRRFVNVRV
ncbi:PBSX family phage terminase large subunit [Christensenellaceae bacterium OttesenSCG-928-L17]|nr:PBSX family phage terminase large subunit [Christensenellaceae bacterium OttesenSCG-928-L17]